MTLAQNKIDSSEKKQPKTRSLFSISDDLEKLNELLDDCDDAQQQELIAQWFEHLGSERDRKLDGYAALITEMMARADVRKAEAKRLQELAASDDNRAKLLKDRLKWFFQTHNLKTVETTRYKLSLAAHGGKQPLILDETVPVTQLPEQYQRVSIDPDTTAIRAALEAGEVLGWAQLGERNEYAHKLTAAIKVHPKMNNHHHKPKCYQYKGCWIEIFLEADSQCDRILYLASIEFPNNEGGMDTESYPTRVEAELAAAQLIDESLLR